MITSADEFIKLRTSELIEDQHRATHDHAELAIWNEIIDKYPEYKEWVIHNKTIQVEILEKLAADPNPKVRIAVARKRKINAKIFDLLSADKSEEVRYALISDTNLSVGQLQKIKVDDSGWLTDQRNAKLR